MQQFEGVECQKLSTLEDELNMLKNELEKAESLEVVS